MEIEHFSHLEGNWNWCPVCTQQILDPAYGNSRSCFTIHKPCVELPREIQHPFHAQHPLTLVKKLPDGSSSFDCCACSLRISGFAYQCIPCQTFFLDISCASLMPVTTNNDSDDAAQRLLFTHPHPLILCNNNRGFNLSCSACELLLTDSIYICLICKLLLHKSCAELPKKIKHPFHQIHPLTLRTNDDGSPFSCKACLMPCSRFIYHCSKCDHSLDIRCASPVRTVRSEIHHHSLAFVNSTYPSNFDCRVCRGNFMAREFYGGNFEMPQFGEDNFPIPKVFRCVDCNFNIHLKCIPTLPETIQNGHRHRLTITDSMVQDRPDEDEKDPTIVYYCDACEQRRHIFDRTYYCAECHFVSHVDCDSVASEVVESLETESFLAKENTVTKKWTSKAREREDMEIQHFSHNCLLMLHNQLNSAKLCALCNQPIPTIWGPPVYGCSKCNFFIHISCAQLPQEINHPFHPQHPLTLFDGPPTRSGKSSCDACGFYSPYYCFYCFWCDFLLDLNCASLAPIEEHECHHKNHTNLGHPHPFVPCITNKNIFYFHCSGYMCPIDGPIFVCLQCHFLLPESCAKSPHEIRHPFHPQHSLMLVERFHHLESCNACRCIFNGFIYRCGECKFKLDTKCALLIPNVKFKLHQHPLVFLTAYRCDCVKCGCKDCKQVFRCVDCDFNLHLHCAPTLPLKAKHQCHRHYLTLTKSPVKDLPDENDDSELYCDVCEQLRYLPDPTYYCAECHFVAHIHCMISEEEALALGEESFVVGQLTGDADDAANHGKTVGEDLNKEGMVVKEEEAGQASDDATHFVHDKLIKEIEALTTKLEALKQELSLKTTMLVVVLVMAIGAVSVVMVGGSKAIAVAVMVVLIGWWWWRQDRV